jgi:hypothetical protein
MNVPLEITPICVCIYTYLDVSLQISHILKKPLTVTTSFSSDKKAGLVDGNTSPSSWTESPNVDFGYGSSCDSIAFVQLDLGNITQITKISRWMYWQDAQTQDPRPGRRYCNQKLSLSLSGQFSGEETVVFSCYSYADCGIETSAGMTISVASVARYVRYYSSRNEFNGGVHFLELQVFETPTVITPTYLYIYIYMCIYICI